MNKKMVLIFILLALAVLVSTSCTAKRNAVAINEGTIEGSRWDVGVYQNAYDRTQDANISSGIMLKFSEDDLISSSRINVDTTNGSVTLSGKVSTQRKADRAMELGRSVEGVKRVRSNLSVKN